MAPITFLVASILGVIFVYLSISVTVQRRRTHVSLGDDVGPTKDGQRSSDTPLLVAIRSQANFEEYVPFSLILLGLIEAHGFRTEVVQVLGGALVLARLMHPIGMGQPVPNFFRAGGILLQWLVLLVMSVLGAYCILGPLLMAHFSTI